MRIVHDTEHSIFYGQEADDGTGYIKIESHADELQTDAAVMSLGYLMTPYSSIPNALRIADLGMDVYITDRPDRWTTNVAELRKDAVVDVTETAIKDKNADGQDHTGVVEIAYSLAGGDAAWAAAELTQQGVYIPIVSLEFATGEIGAHVGSDAIKNAWSNMWYNLRHPDKAIRDFVLSFEEMEGALQQMVDSPLQVLCEGFLALRNARHDELKYLVSEDVTVVASYGKQDSTLGRPWPWERVEGVEHLIVDGGHFEPIHEPTFAANQIQIAQTLRIDNPSIAA